MKAMAFHEHGPADNLQLVDLPDPSPSGRDLLIRVKSSAMNPVDFKVREGGLPMELPKPAVLGFDVSGVVEAVGDEVSGFSVGDEVYASPSLARPGANAQFVLVDHRTAAKKPPSLNHDAAAALPLAVITAWEALFDKARLQPEETVLIQAGGGGVGHLAIQLAKHHGARVLATASVDASIDLCRQCGADEVINYRQEGVVQRVQELTEGAGCGVVFEMVGGHTFEESLDCVAVRGRLVSILPSHSRNVGEKLFFKDASLLYEFMGAPGIHGVNPEGHGQILQQVADLVEQGALEPYVSATYPVGQLADAHRMQETGHVRGKLAIRVED